MAEPCNPLFSAPMQLCRPSRCHTFLETVPETLDALCAVDATVSVVAGVGSQRIGKSTILNLLHSRRTSGFGLGHTLDPQTAGMWIWLRVHPKDPSIVVVFVDTEGLDTPHIAQSYNWMLSALTLLVSGVFLYQSKSSIDSSATERLSTILAVAEQMLGDRDANSLASKPSFVWVLRDMQLKMQHDPKTEMMEKLETVHIKKMQRSFRDFDCFPLPRPVDTEDELQEVERMDFEALKPNFQEEFFLLDRLVFKLAAAPAMVGSIKTTGPMLAEMLSRYIDAIRDRKGLLSSITELPSQAQLIGKMAAERAVKEGKNHYKNSMDALIKELPLSLDEILERHKTALGDAEAAAQEAALGVEADDLMDVARDLRAFALTEDPMLGLSAQAEEGAGGSMVFCSQRRIDGYLLKVLERNEQLAQSAASKRWQQTYAPVAERVETCAFRDVREYDEAAAAVRRELLDAADEGCGGREVLARQLRLHSAILARDREAVLLQVLSQQMKAMEEAQTQRVNAIKESLQQELAAERAREAGQRDELREQLRQEIAETRQEETEARQKIEAAVLKEELARTHGVAEVTSALQKEAVERAAALAAVKADVVEVDKAVGQARLESANEVANVRVSIMQLESSGEATRHEAESERRRIRDELLQKSDSDFSKAQQEQRDAIAAVRLDSERATLAAEDRCQELESMMRKVDEEVKMKLSGIETTAQAAVTAAAEVEVVKKRLQEVEIGASEMNAKALEAAAAAQHAKVDMEKAAAAAIASAHREMEEVWMGAASDLLSLRGETGSGAAASGGVTARMKEFFKRFNV